MDSFVTSSNTTKKPLRSSIKKLTSVSNLPNLYLLLDILNMAHSTVRAACVFRILNKKCYEFYLANRQYLLKTQTFDSKDGPKGNRIKNWSLLDNMQL